MADDQRTSISACTVSELRPNVHRVAEHDGEPIVVVNRPGTLFAIGNRSSYEDATLDEGKLDPDGCAIECPRHGSIFVESFLIGGRGASLIGRTC